LAGKWQPDALLLQLDAFLPQQRPDALVQPVCRRAWLPLHSVPALWTLVTAAAVQRRRQSHRSAPALRRPSAAATGAAWNRVTQFFV